MGITVDEFRKVRSTEARTAEARRIRAKYPDRIPVVACPDPTAHGLPEIDRHKFLAPASMTMGEMCYVLRKRMKLPPARAMFVFCENSVLPPTSAIMSDLYAQHKHHDDFLYLTFTTENTFGAASQGADRA